MNTYLILAFFIVCAFSQSYCGTTDLACAKAKKTMIVKEEEREAMYPRASYEIPESGVSSKRCRSNRKDAYSTPFPMSFAFAAAETATFALHESNSTLSKVYLSAQMILDGLAAKHKSEEASLFATFDLEDALNFLMEEGVCTEAKYGDATNLSTPSIADYNAKKETCGTIYKIDSYEHISGSIKDILNRFNGGHIVLSVMIGQDQTEFVYPVEDVDQVSTYVDLATGWEDRAEGDQHCDGTGCFHNDISAWSTADKFTPTFTYFGRMYSYSITEGVPESWTIDACIYRRFDSDYSEMRFYNALNHFRGEYETTDQGTDTGFLGYGAYQVYVGKNKCVVDPIDDLFTLTQDEEEFMETQNINYCTLSSVNEYTFVGLTDATLPMVKNILTYIFANNKNNESGKWDNLKTLTFVGVQSIPANQLSDNDDNTGLLLNIKDLLTETAVIITKFPEFQLESARRLSEANVDANTHLRA